MSTVAEIGYSSKKTAGETQCGSSENFAANKSCDLSKVTLAQQWSPVDDGGFWARPSFRLFVSHYAGERAIDKADTMFGAQVEAWW